MTEIRGEIRILGQAVLTHLTSPTLSYLKHGGDTLNSLQTHKPKSNLIAIIWYIIGWAGNSLLQSCMVAWPGLDSMQRFGWRVKSLLFKYDFRYCPSLGVRGIIAPFQNWNMLCYVNFWSKMSSPSQCFFFSYRPISVVQCTWCRWRRCWLATRRSQAGTNQIERQNSSESQTWAHIGIPQNSSGPALGWPSSVFIPYGSSSLSSGPGIPPDIWAWCRTDLRFAPLEFDTMVCSLICINNLYWSMPGLDWSDKGVLLPYLQYHPRLIDAVYSTSRLLVVTVDF